MKQCNKKKQLVVGNLNIELFVGALLGVITCVDTQFLDAINYQYYSVINNATYKN